MHTTSLNFKMFIWHRYMNHNKTGKQTEKIYPRNIFFSFRNGVQRMVVVWITETGVITGNAGLNNRNLCFRGRWEFELKKHRNWIWKGGLGLELEKPAFEKIAEVLITETGNQRVFWVWIRETGGSKVKWGFELQKLEFPSELRTFFYSQKWE